MPNVNSLIVYLIPPEKIINGGVMSIFSMTKETRNLHSIHNAEVVICTYVGYKTYHKNDLFENEEYVYSFDEIVEKYKYVRYLMINVPELAVNKLSNRLDEYNEYLKKIETLQINILNQNILYMPEYSQIFPLFRFTSNITQTTAHKSYSTQEVSDKYCLPLKHLSVFIDPKQYYFTNYQQKENLIVFSKDSHPMKEAVLRAISEKAPQYRLLEINDIKYEDYKKLISRAKFVITFGEGFDGYFIESSFSGTIPLAVYNDDFFPSKDFLAVDGIYSSYDVMLENIVDDLTLLDTRLQYKKSNDKLFKMLKKIYNFDIYIKNLSSFYEGIFDFIPDPKHHLEASRDEIRNMLVELKSDKDKIDKLDKVVQLHKKEIERYQHDYQKKSKEYEDRSKELELILNSRSWKLTRFVRILLGEER